MESDYNGCVLERLGSLHNINAVCTWKERRLVFTGTLGISRTSGSYRFGDELQIAVYSKDLPRDESRAEHDGYSRFLIAIPLADAVELLKEAIGKLEVKKNKNLEDFCVGGK